MANGDTQTQTSTTSTAGVQAVGAIFQSLFAAQAQRRDAKLRAEIAEHNARMFELQARDALKRGESAASARLRKAGRTAGGTKAAFAGQGINVAGGSAQDIQFETLEAGELDATTIRSNAAREAMGFSSGATQERLKGELGKIEAKGRAQETLLAGGLRAASFIRGSSNARSS